MDYGSLDTVIQKRERGYIWLEQRLKKNLAVTTLFVTACFLFILILEILYGTGQKEEFRIGFFSIFLLAVIGNVLWQFVSYRKEYREYLSLQEYLEAFANVIENSVKYSPEGSRVKIRVEPYISYISVEVEDQGMGIDKKEYTNIFQRFYRGKEAERTGLDGAGVGLYLVRKILEEQGGNVRVLKSGAWGTTFQMVLPKENEACEYKK
ncbi:MAG: sensor histidine kinase [Lachnospiraceae bacterium]